MRSPPTPSFSSTDKQILELLSKLLLDCDDVLPEKSNKSKGFVALSEKEAQELSLLLANLVNTRRFIEASYFVESITDPKEDDKAREILLSNRSKLGRTRVMSSRYWAEFKMRLSGDSPGMALRTVNPMPIGHFMKMEEHLLLASGLNPSVVKIIIGAIAQQESAIEDLRKRRQQLRHGLIKGVIFNPIINWTKKISALPNHEIPRERLIGAMTVITDTSVLFTTRDWGVAGTISTMAGAMVAASPR